MAPSRHVGESLPIENVFNNIEIFFNNIENVFNNIEILSNDIENLFNNIEILFNDIENVFNHIEIFFNNIEIVFNVEEPAAPAAQGSFRTVTRRVLVSAAQAPSTECGGHAAA